MILGFVIVPIESGQPGSKIKNLNDGLWWSIQTLTTVGYGDIAPQTPIGQMLACLVMILGYGIIAVPTGIVTVEVVQAAKMKTAVTTHACPHCSRYGHDADAVHCKYCGAKL